MQTTTSQPRARLKNLYAGRCSTCSRPVGPEQGEFFEGPLRLACAACALLEAASPGDLHDRLQTMPTGRVLMPFQLEDVKRVANTRALLLGHQMGCGKCCHLDTPIVANGCLIKAKDLWSEYASKSLVEGDGLGYWSKPNKPLFVNALNNETGQILRARVVNLYRQKVSEKLRKVTLNDGSEVTITQAHKLYKTDRWSNEIAVGDRVCVPTRLEHESGEFDLGLAELFGWAIGDGTERSGGHECVITQKDASVLDHLETIFTSIVGRLGIKNARTRRGRPRESHLSPDVVFGGKGFVEFCKSLDYPWGTLSADRRVPTPIMQAGPDPVRVFLRAYFDADGSVDTKHRRVEVSSASQLLMKEVGVLLRRFGIWLRTRKKRARATNGKDGGVWRDYWIGTIGGPSLRRFREEVGFSIDYKSAGLTEICEKKANSNTEGLPASARVVAIHKKSGLTASMFGLDPKNGLSTVYLKGTQEFSREVLQVVVDHMDRILSGSARDELYEGRQNCWSKKNLDALERLDFSWFEFERNALQRLIDQECHYPEVVSVEEVDYDDWVYDLEVEDHHNYVAEGVLCHNTIIAATGGLRNDMPNLIFCPASVRENWCDEIVKWRPDLNPDVVKSQADFKSLFEDGFFSGRGDVAIASFGVLPGAPCPGCTYLKTRLRVLKKERRYHGNLNPPCMHVGPGVEHPPYYDVAVDSVQLRLPFHFKGSTEEWLEAGVNIPRTGRKPNLPRHEQTCPGCYQPNPLPEVPAPCVLLADECHALKTASVQRTKCWRALRERVWAAGGYVYGLSGTPCEGKPGEFWEVLKSLGLEVAAFDSWANYFRIFEHWFTNPKGMRRPPNGPIRDDLHNRLKRIQINRRRKDVLSQLPPRRLQTISVEITEKTIRDVNEAVHRMFATRYAWRDVTVTMGPNRLANPFEPRISADECARRKGLYQDRVEQYFKARPWSLDEEIVEAVKESLMSRNDMPTIDQLSRIRAMLSQAKVAAVTEWIRDREEEEEPVVLFSQHVSVLKKISERPGWECYHGGLTAKQRHAMVKRFQSGEIERGLCVSIGAGGEGITLTRASVAGFIDLSWNPARNQQSESRLIRIGAEVHDFIMIVRFRAKHVVDELVHQTLSEKEKLLDAMEWNDELEQA